MGVKEKLSFRVFAFFFIDADFGKREGWTAALLLLRLRLPFTARTGLTIDVLSSLLRLVLRQLGLLSRHDAVIMLRMLKVILRHHAIAAGIGVAGELEIFLVDMAGGATNLDFRARGIECPVGVEPAAIVMAAATTSTAIAVLRPAAASA